MLLSMLPLLASALAPPVRMKASLPGVASTAPYEYFSGFLDAGTPPSGRGKMYFHYICAMAPDWRHKPVSLWYNGGPGAPSTYGLFQEFGPFLLSDASYATDAFRTTGLPTPLRNPYTWANVTSLCEIDSPAPMGASFCTEGNGTAGSKGGPGGDAYSCGPWTDLSVAAADHQAHIAFFTLAFPEFARNQNPVTIIGESYAGIYIPYFIDAWLRDPIPGVNLVGFAIGDGCTSCVPMAGRPVNWCIDLFHEGFEYPNSLPGPYWDVNFFWGHSQFSTSLKDEIMATCTTDELVGITPPQRWSAACTHLITKRMADEVGYYFVYNLLESCPNEVPPTHRRHRRLAHRRLSQPAHEARRAAAVEADGSADHAPDHAQHATVMGGAGVPNAAGPAFHAYGDGDSGLGAPCLTDSMEVYFAANATLSALGIPPDNNFIVLDNGIGMNYTIDAPFVGPVYERAIKAGLRVLVYEGDSDASGLQTLPMYDVWVPFFGNGSGAWTPAGRLNASDPHGRPLGLPLTQPWRPFGVAPSGRKVQGGYVMEWAHGQATFASIRGAGHLAPTYRPSAAFTVMEAFITNKSLPPRI